MALDINPETIKYLDRLVKRGGFQAEQARSVLAAAGFEYFDGELQAVAEPDAEKREFSDTEREGLADKGHAMPDGSFPITDEASLKDAIQAHGRAKDIDAAKRHIKRRAKALGREDLIPEEWSKSKKAVTPKISKSDRKALETLAKQAGKDGAKAREILAKYSEDQPRDDHGRFSGGGGSGDGGDGGKSGGGSSSELRHEGREDEQNKYIADRLEIGKYKSSFTKKDMDHIDELASRIRAGKIDNLSEKDLLRIRQLIHQEHGIGYPDGIARKVYWNIGAERVAHAAGFMDRIGKTDEWLKGSPYANDKTSSVYQLARAEGKRLRQK